MRHMRGLRPLLLAALALAALGPGAAAAAACGTSTYARSSNTLQIVPGAGCTVTINATGSDAYILATDGGTWRDPSLSGPDPGGAALVQLSAGITAIEVTDAPGAPSTVVIAGLADNANQPVPWVDDLVISQGQPASSVAFASVPGLAAPIAFGGKPVSVLSPDIRVLQDVRGASEITLSSPNPVELVADLSATGLIRLPAVQVRLDGPRVLTAGTVEVNGALTGTLDCLAVGPSICSASAPSGLTIVGALRTGAAWSGLGDLEVTGAAELGGDVSATGYQIWNGSIRVDAPSLTLAGAIVITLRDIGAYGSPCGASDVNGCGLEVQSPAPVFADLRIEGDWEVGGSVTPRDTITVTGLTISAGEDVGYQIFSATTSGAQDYRGGLMIEFPRSAVLSGSTVTIAGMPVLRPAGASAAYACDSGPLTVIGSLRLTGPVECLASLIATGPATIAADVTTLDHQTYQGPVTVALGADPIRLRAGAGHVVGFRTASVAATWPAAAGEVAGYTASIAPSGQSCTTTGELACSFDSVPDAADLAFSVTARRPAATTPTAGAREPAATAPTTTRRTVARGTRTRLNRLITPPSMPGRRVWSERGPCRIRRGALIAPRVGGTCTVTLRVVRGGTTAWTGRSVVTVA
jgi:hypothetical protein